MGRGKGGRAGEAADPFSDPELVPAVLAGVEYGDPAAMRAFATLLVIIPGAGVGAAATTLRRYRAGTLRSPGARKVAAPERKVVAYRFDRGAGKNEQVWATVERFKGRECIHLRTYFLGRTGDYIPTRRGVSIPMTQFVELAKAVLALAAEIARWPAAPANSPEAVEPEGAAATWNPEHENPGTLDARS